MARTVGGSAVSEKTEQPTAQKLRKAREEGQVAKSKDFTQTVLTLALFGYLLSAGPMLVRRMGEMMVMPAHVFKMDFYAAANVIVTELMWEAIWMLMPFLLIVIGLGLFVEMAQSGMLMSFKAMKPSAKKLNVITNVKNIVGVKNLVEFLKSNIKIAILSTILYFLIRDSLSVLLTLPQGGLVGVGVAVAMLLKSMVIQISVGYAIIAAADFIWQRKQHTKQLMMSKDEVKQEYKQAEGDQHIKHQRKHLHQEMLQEGAVERTRQASAVIVNPTHIAIAVLYDKETTPLPLVVAKGEGALAARMVQAARESGVPVLQNIPLARAMMETAEVDQYIPSDLVEAVAEVLRMVQAINQERE